MQVPHPADLVLFFGRSRRFFALKGKRRSSFHDK
jgi:hypothetical protein